MGGGNLGGGKGGRTTWADDAWRRDLDACAHCHAEAQEVCRTPSGASRPPHDGQTQMVRPSPAGRIAEAPRKAPRRTGR